MGTIRLRPLAHGEIAGNEPTFLKRAFAGDFSATLKGYSKADVLELAFAGGYGETLEMSSRAKKIWFKSYLDSLLLHDIRELMDVRSYQILRKMMEALLGRSAKFVDATEFTSAFGIKHETFSRHLSILKTLYLIDEVEAWHRTDYDGLGKRSKHQDKYSSGRREKVWCISPVLPKRRGAISVTSRSFSNADISLRVSVSRSQKYSAPAYPRIKNGFLSFMRVKISGSTTIPLQKFCNTFIAGSLCTATQSAAILFSTNVSRHAIQ